MSAPHAVTPDPAPLPAERILEIAAPMLTEIGGVWTLEPGPILRSSGSLAVRVATSHSGNYRHIDLEIILNADRPDAPTIVDIIGQVNGWGFDETAAKQHWIANTAPWTILAPVIATGLDRPMLNGVRIFIGQSSTYTECEVFINGVRHEPSSAALTAMDWPRTEKMSVARTFLLLVHPADE